MWPGFHPQTSIQEAKGAASLWCGGAILINMTNREIKKKLTVDQRMQPDPDQP